MRSKKTTNADELREQLVQLRYLVNFLRSSQLGSVLKMLDQHFETARIELESITLTADIFHNVDEARKHIVHGRSQLLRLNEEVEMLLRTLESIIPALERQLKEAEKLQPTLPNIR